MDTFHFQTTRSVLAEIGGTAKIGEILAKQGCRKVAFVTDRVILDLGLAEAALDGFREAGLDVWTFPDVQPDPPEAMILDAVEQARVSMSIAWHPSVGGHRWIRQSSLRSCSTPTSRSAKCMG